MWRAPVFSFWRPSMLQTGSESTESDTIRRRGELKVDGVALAQLQSLSAPTAIARGELKITVTVQEGVPGDFRTRGDIAPFCCTNDEPGQRNRSHIYWT